MFETARRFFVHCLPCARSIETISSEAPQPSHLPHHRAHCSPELRATQPTKTPERLHAEKHETLIHAIEKGDVELFDRIYAKLPKGFYSTVRNDFNGNASFNNIFDQPTTKLAESKSKRTMRLINACVGSNSGNATKILSRLTNELHIDTNDHVEGEEIPIFKAIESNNSQAIEILREVSDPEQIYTIKTLKRNQNQAQHYFTNQHGSLVKEDNDTKLEQDEDIFEMSPFQYAQYLQKYDLMKLIKGLAAQHQQSD